MAVIVLDASVAVKWYVHERHCEPALELLDREDVLFVAPDIFLPKVVNALLRQQRAAKFDGELLDRALDDLTLTCPELVGSKNLIAHAAALSRSIAHPIYDCLYLALAERWDTVLVTADEEFIDVCRRRLGDGPLLARMRLLEDYRAL